MDKMAVSGLVAVMAVASFADTTVTTNGTELTIDVPTGGSYTHVEAVPSSFTKITKTGAGSCAFAPETITFTGTMDIQAGTMHGDRAKFGAPAAWKVTPGAALRFDEVSSGYAAGETGKPSGSLEIGGMGCDGYPAYYYTMLPNGSPYTTSHGNFIGGVKLTADTSVGGGRFGFGTMDMQGYDLYLYCTNGQARYEMYYDIANLGNIRIKKGSVLIEDRSMSSATAISGQAYIMANGANIYMYNVSPTYQGVKLNVGLEDDASGKITMTGGGALSANRNTWCGDWVLGKGKQLWLYTDSLTHPGTMKGNIDAPFTEIYKSGDGPYTITADGTHKFKVLSVANGVLFLGANKDGSTYQITNLWSMSGSAQDNNVTRLTLGPGLKTVSAGTQKIANEGIIVASSVNASSGQRNAIVDISDGCVISNNFLLGTDNSGGTKAAVGAIYMGDATVYWKAGGSNDGFIGQNTKGYGYLLQKAGTFTHRGYLNLGATGRGRVDQRGGTHRIETGDPLKFARSGGTSWGCYYQTGGTFDGKALWFNYNYVTNCSAVESVLTTTGANSLFKCDSMQAHMSRLNVDTIVNVNDGATLQGRLYREIAFSGYNSSMWGTLSPQMTNTTHLYVNLNGGVIKNCSNLSVDLWGADRMRGPTRATVYEKGVTFDTTAKDITLNTELVKPFGKGVKSVTLPSDPAWLTGTNHYIAPPRVRLTSQTGTGASAVAVFDETKRQIVRIDIASPGCGYEDAAASIEDVGLGIWETGINVQLENLMTTGGVRKVGTGTLTLAGANTYGGVTRVENGQVVFTHSNGLPANSALEFAAAAVAGGDKTAPLLTAVNYNGGEIRITEADTLDFGTFGRSRVLATFTNALTAMPTVKLVNSDGTELASADWKASLSEDGKTLRFGRNIGLMLLLR